VGHQAPVCRGHPLRAKVETLPEELSARLQDTVEDTARKLAADFRGQRSLLEARFSGERNVLSSKIEALEARVECQKAPITALGASTERPTATAASERSSRLRP
jgi:hypothetical protein